VVQVFTVSLKEAMMSPQPQPDDTKEWLDLKAITHQYACVSERTVREWLHRLKNPLPAVQVGNKILIRRSVFDQWLEAHPFRPVVSIDIDLVVNDVLHGLRKAS
jgi:excisionase family DNA binding protein